MEKEDSWAKVEGAEFGTHLCTYRNLHSWNSRRGEERGREEGGGAKEGRQT